MPNRLPDDDEIEDEDTGFTPEEEAALDAAAKGDDVEIVVEPKKKDDVVVKDTKTKDDKVVVTEEADDAAVDPDEEIASLKKKVADAEARAESEAQKRKEIESRSVTSVDQQEQAEQARLQAQEEKMAADLTVVERDVKDLTRELTEAIEAGDIGKQVEINDKLLDVKIKKKQITEAQQYTERLKPQRKEYWERQRGEAARKAERVESDKPYFNPDEFTPKALAWVDKHPEFKTSKEFNAKAIRAHYSAVGEGIAEDSDEYFAFIDKKLGFTDEGDDTEVVVEPKKVVAKKVVNDPPAKKKVQSQLPPSRDSGTVTTRQTGTRIKKLTADEVEHAQISGMTNEEYWDDKYGQQNNS